MGKDGREKDTEGQKEQREKFKQTIQKKNQAIKKKKRQRAAQIWMGIPPGGCAVMPMPVDPPAMRSLASAATPAPGLRWRSPCRVCSSASSLAMVAFANTSSDSLSSLAECVLGVMAATEGTSRCEVVPPPGAVVSVDWATTNGGGDESKCWPFLETVAHCHQKTPHTAHRVKGFGG